MRYWICFIVVSVSLFAVLPTNAALPSLVPDVCKGDAPVTKGGCDLTAFEQAIANAAQIILGIAGSLTLLMFIVGGVQLLISGGNSKMIEKGRTTIKYAVFGLAIILLAGVIIKLLIGKLTGVT
jgi:hypothetical protein